MNYITPGQILDNVMVRNHGKNLANVSTSELIACANRTNAAIEKLIAQSADFLIATDKKGLESNAIF